MSIVAASDILRANVVQRLGERDQKELADGAGLSAAAVSMFLSGRRGVPIDTAERIAGFFGVPLADLLRAPGAPPPVDALAPQPEAFLTRRDAERMIHDALETRAPTLMDFHEATLVSTIRMLSSDTEKAKAVAAFVRDVTSRQSKRKHGRSESDSEGIQVSLRRGM